MVVAVRAKTTEKCGKRRGDNAVSFTRPRERPSRTAGTAGATLLGGARSPEAIEGEVPMERKYGPKASEKVEQAMHEMKRGKLRSGSGKKVTSKKQAIAIGLSQARKAGGKVPAKKS
jgi:hypothetical protein